MVTASLTGLVRTIFIIVVSLLIVRFIARTMEQRAAAKKRQEMEDERRRMQNQKQLDVTIQRKPSEDGEYVDYEIIE